MYQCAGVMHWKQRASFLWDMKLQIYIKSLNWAIVKLVFWLMKYKRDPKIRNSWSFSCRKQSSNVLCKLEPCWQTPQRHRPAMDSAGRFSLTQKLIDSPGETCGSFTFHVRTARARFEWSQALLRRVLACGHVVTEPKPDSNRHTSGICCPDTWSPVFEVSQ